ncbi:MAG: tRNA (adenosine(37)-N6)-threonylcarbamoyltransferase complex dimerization subunit type 1 TsaB, partial [Lachnospiraceae bacterium]|nr:tRNA (adenosine(37)-N6)-threonylcarbamoyltransferase complex dimerization subunit type 1 TsaB [Lachnospiraceae bacterium]
MKILGLDSSGLVASVAVVEEDVTIAEYTVNYKKTHSQTLLPMFDEIKRMTELDLHTLDAIAIAAGPGSFTGLRIGSATAKGLGLALNIPIIPVPTVDALAYNAYGCGTLICPLMDARRNQVYTGLYEFQKRTEAGAGYELCTIEKQCAVSLAEIVGKINELCRENDREVLFLGDGVAVYRDQITALTTGKYSFAPLCCNRQRASCVAALGAELYKKGISETAAEHAPEYLRLSQAERERTEHTADKYHIREMRRSDLEEVTALEASCFSMPWKYGDFEETLTNPNRVYLVAQAETADIKERILG